MANKTIAFTAANLAVTTDKITVSRINLKPDNSGDWNIGVDFTVTSPVRNAGNDKTVSIMERHMLSAVITVGRTEIATAANVTEEDVRTGLTLAQTETYVTQIALSKLFPAMGIAPQNIVIA